MEKTPWELPEIIAGSLLIAVSALGAGGLASGIVAAALSSDSTPGYGAAQILSQSTGWAGTFAALMVLIGLFIIWWHAYTWSEAVDPEEDAPSDALQFDAGTNGLGANGVGADGEGADGVGADRVGATEETKEAVGHLLRAGKLAFWGARLSGVIAAGAIAYFIAYQIQERSLDGSQVVWQLRTVQIGALVAALVLSTAGILGAVWIRRLCFAYVPEVVQEQGELQM